MESLPLLEVSAFFIGVEEEKKEEAAMLLQAFGGRSVEDKNVATHAIVPDHLAKREWAKLRPEIKVFCQERKHVPSVAWLNEVISGKVDPSDIDAVIQHTPPYVRDLSMQVVDSGRAPTSWRDEGRLRPRRGAGSGSAQGGGGSAGAQGVLRDGQAAGTHLRSAAADAEREPGTLVAASPAPAAKRRRTSKTKQQPDEQLGEVPHEGQPADEPGAERQQRLVTSLAETHEFLAQESPEELEEAQLRLALQRSLLDCALQPLTGGGGSSASGASAAEGQPSQAPEEVLGVSRGATAAEVRAAFRERARASHPDKGGDPQVFCRVKQAYLSLMASAKAGQAGTESRAASSGGRAEPLALAGGAAAHDFVLRDHRALVRAAFGRDGVDLQAIVARQRSALGSLGLEPCECGSVVTNARGQAMRNQCFYLSLARSYLGAGSSKEDVATTALDLKRVVETAVLEAHPDWGGGRVGEHVQAFSDFLFFVLGSHPLLSEWSVAVFDETSGGVEVYTGSDFPGPEREEEQRSNLLTLWFTPGHYQALMPSRQRGAVAAEPGRPNLAELQRCLEEHGVACVPTQL